ncbi:hypothetical protein HN51_031548 [Arachis hypogaea]
MPGDGGDDSGGGGVAIKGGNIYWGRKGGTDFRGIVVIFAWVSIPHNLLRKFVDSSLGWNSLVCYAHYLSAFHDENVMSLAFSVLKELIEELRIRPCPVVFATFSAGSKACLNKVFQLIEGGCEVRIHMNFGASFLVVCSENDDHVRYQSIYDFAQRLCNLGGDINLLNLSGSSHVGHYKQHSIQYRAAVSKLFEKAASIYSQKLILKRERTHMEGAQDEISELICDLRKVAINSNKSLRRVAVGPRDHFFMPSAAGHYNDRDSGTVQDEQKEKPLFLPSSPSISAHSVLGQFLFDVCVRKNVEGWDVKFSGTPNERLCSSAPRHSPLSGIKRIRRSRL